jgi:hypothetical protein
MTALKKVKREKRDWIIDPQFPFGSQIFPSRIRLYFQMEPSRRSEYLTPDLGRFMRFISY